MLRIIDLMLCVQLGDSNNNNTAFIQTSIKRKRAGSGLGEVSLKHE